AEIARCEECCDSRGISGGRDARPGTAGRRKGTAPFRTVGAGERRDHHPGTIFGACWTERVTAMALRIAIAAQENLADAWRTCGSAGTASGHQTKISVGCGSRAVF